ncbi:MBL fold metallo-hydrolase [Pseudohalocynthiibacter aestuariivivens]|uniref:MBL fold metallo-hydrolase n=1 Tax=Roseovarius pelagicus TaxID=2980108 RepID=A0ABY6DAR3_9RHOB|nr:MULTISPECIES: MBL fold metallo-hydrolase [Rhodobacterales]QIE44862.1 MBL fold metallo-hydrolase [Pseudohalocynthiibacter aestuariivivens]UXX83231.1 MBL fold metallo-hydrolase [Roseovarius pelagicus]
MAERRFIILGCGSSGGVPRLGGHWGDCDPEEPRNTRRRCSMLIEQEGPEGITRVLIDTSPDLRAQLLSVGVGVLDAVLFTHSHADHVHGIDDLRVVVFNTKKRLPVWADGDTQNALYARFGYAFVQPDTSPYPPILNMNTIDGDVTIDGAGGAITLTPFTVGHGAIDALGFRIGDVAYLPDVADIPDDVWPLLDGLECWIVDALRRTPHPTHSHLENTLKWIDRAAPRNAVITNMHIDMDYRTLERELPENVIPAYDGLTLAYDV